jgi:hypothetical protein
MINLESKKNNGLLITIVILLILVVIGIGYVIYNNQLQTKGVTNNSVNTQENKEEKEIVQTVDYITAEKLLKIVDIKDNEQDLYGIQSVLVDITGNVLNSLNNDNIQNIIFWYAQNNNMITKINGSEYNFCSAGLGYCNGIIENDAIMIAKLYGINDISKYYSNDLIYTRNGTKFYLSNYDGDVCIKKIKHNLTLEYSDKNIIMKDNATITNTTENETKTKTIIYTFKVNSENNYYLDNVSNNG